MHELDRELAPNATICADVGTCISWTFRGIPVRRPGRFFATVDFSPMGCGIAGAIGVALARPEEHVICIAGDGAFLMHGTEISTAVAHGIRVTWAVLNDGQMSASAGPVSGRMDPSPVARIGANDLAAMARALGRKGFGSIRAASCAPVCKSVGRHRSLRPRYRDRSRDQQTRHWTGSIGHQPRVQEFIKDPARVRADTDAHDCDPQRADCPGHDRP